MYLGLSFQSNTPFQQMYLRTLEICAKYVKMYELDPSKFLSAPELALQAAFKRLK